MTHSFKASYSGMVCDQMVIRDGAGDACGLPADAAPHKPPAAIVPAPPGSRLAELAARYAALKPAADEAAEQLQEVKDAIKVELANAAPDAEDITLQSTAATLRLRYKPSMRFNVKGFKAADPLTYARFTEPSGHWELGKG